MNQTKALKLQSRGKLVEDCHFRVTSSEKEHFQRALEELNAISPILNFNLGDLLRMAGIDFADRLLTKMCKVKLDIPTREITFSHKKTKKGGINGEKP